MPPGRKKARDPEVRAAVLAALLAGQSITAVASTYRIPTGTIKAWAKRARDRGDTVAEVADDATAKKRKVEVGELILAYLRENLTTLRAQQEVFRDREWLKTQSAGELAVLHGVTVDKAVRLLEAMGGPGAGDT